MTNQLGRYAIFLCSWDVDSLVGRATNLKAQQAIVVQSAMRLVARKTRVVPPIRQFAESTLGSQTVTEAIVCSQQIGRFFNFTKRSLGADQ